MSLLRSASAACLALAATLAVAPGAPAQSTTAAHVYVQVGGTAGAVYAWNASSSGQLSSIPGSPFKPGTEIIGGSNSRFITLGHTLLHSYGVAASGALTAQIAQASVFNYAGSSCGNPSQGASGGVLDHNGKYVYVMIGPNGCVAYQSYMINSDGSFTFAGDTEKAQNLSGADLENYAFGLPSILGSENFAYAEYPCTNCGESLIGFRRDSSGALQLMPFNETDPPTSGFPDAHNPDASPAGNYVVAQVNPNLASPTYLASYTVDSAGNLSTTNTTANMPTTSLIGSGPSNTRSNSAFSPAGDLFVLYGGALNPGSAGNGIEIYHFNGAAPLTLYTKLLTGTPINDVAWDSSHHLYAISTATNKLYVFTVTSTAVSAPTSVSLSAPFKLVVVSQTGACSAPSTAGVNVCSPGDGTTVTSPLSVSAAATISGGIYRFSLWNGNTKLVEERNTGTMDESVSLAPGTYHLVFDARNAAGDHQTATRTVTVQ